MATPTVASVSAGASLMPSPSMATPGADRPLEVALHQQLQHRLGHGSQKISIASLLQQIGQHQSLFGDRVLSRASG
jgi:hypothetical protein